MSKNKKKLHILFFILSLIVFFLFIFIYKIEKTIETQKQDIPLASRIEKTASAKSAISPSKIKKGPEIQKEKTQSVTILAGKATAHLFISPNTILYDALTQAKNTNVVIFSGKNYSSLGFFVTDIGTLHSGNGKNLLYYINGKQATVGVSSYTLKDGDIIEWKLE